MGIFAARDIQPGEELVYDYFFSTYGAMKQSAAAFKCMCGAKNCRYGGRKIGRTCSNYSLHNARVRLLGCYPVSKLSAVPAFRLQVVSCAHLGSAACYYCTANAMHEWARLRFCDTPG